MSGWFKHNRNLFDRPWAKDPKMVAVYEYLHCVAYVNDGKLHGHIIRRGSCMTSRKDIMEETGLSDYEVKSRLQKLLEAGEIIVKSTNYGTIITLCDYDGYSDTEDLFSLNPSSQLPNQPPANYPTNHQSLYIKEGRITEDSLRTHFVPSKTERETRDVALEIKNLYNKTFGGILRRWDRLSAEMRIKINTCISRFGRQSVDMVFDQVKHEKFSLGENDTGFIADFAFIFKPNNYDAYLGRYELRMKKGQKPKLQASEQPQQQVSNGSWLDAYNEDKNWKPNIKK